MSINERLHGLIKRAISTKDLHPCRPNTLKLGNSMCCLSDPRRPPSACQLAFPIQSGCNKAPDEDEDMRSLYYDGYMAHIGYPWVHSASNTVFFYCRNN